VVIPEFLCWESFAADRAIVWVSPVTPLEMLLDFGNFRKTICSRTTAGPFDGIHFLEMTSQSSFSISYDFFALLDHWPMLSLILVVS
jgi:hypothetical protein